MMDKRAAAETSRAAAAAISLEDDGQGGHYIYCEQMLDNALKAYIESEDRHLKILRVFYRARLRVCGIETVRAGSRKMAYKLKKEDPRTRVHRVVVYRRKKR